MKRDKSLRKLLSSKKSQSSLFGQIAHEEQIKEQKRQSILDTINSPKDIKKLDRQQLKFLAQEIRDRIIEVVSRNGGHLGGP